MITLENGFPQGPNGLIVPNGSISLQLNVDATVIASPYGFVCAAIPVIFQFDEDGALIQPARIWSNAELNPQLSTTLLGTYYLVTFYDQNGAVLNSTPMWWQFPEADGETVDISRMKPFSTVGGNVIFYPVLAGVGAIPPPTPTTLGGVFSNIGATHQWIRSINLDGSVSLSQPTYSDIGGNPIAAGSNTQVQFNDGGIFGGNSGFTYTKTTQALGGLLGLYADPTETTYPDITITPQGTTGSTSYSYYVVAQKGVLGIIDIDTILVDGYPEISNGNDTLDNTNFNRITWAAVPGATSYTVYRISQPQGIIGTTSAFQFDDTGMDPDVLSSEPLLTDENGWVGVYPGLVVGGPVARIVDSAPIYQPVIVSSGRVDILVDGAHANQAINIKTHNVPGSPGYGVPIGMSMLVRSQGVSGIQQDMTGISIIVESQNTDTPAALIGMEIFCDCHGTSDTWTGLSLTAVQIPDLGHINTAKGIFVGSVGGAHGEIVSAYGIYIEDQSSPPVVTTTHYALYIAEQTLGSWSVYSVGGPNFFGGSITVANILTFNGSGSGSASIGVAAAAGTPNKLVLPVSTATANNLLVSDGGNPQQLSWSTGMTYSSNTLTLPALKFSGATSGSATIGAASIAGTPNRINLPTTNGTVGQVLTTDGGNPQQTSWTTISGTGTVTSVGLVGDGVIYDPTVTGSPVTSSGTLTPVLLSQAAHKVLIGPTSSSATPTFRILDPTDIPNLAATIITSGQLALARGGTHADLSATGGTSFVLRQSSVGADITVSQLAASDLSNGVTGSGAVVLAAAPALTGNATAVTQLAADNSTRVATTAFVQSVALTAGAVTSVFGRAGVVVAVSGDYGFADISGTAGLAQGGTHADLSGTGGASQVLKQVSVGANITVGQLAASDLSNGVTGSGAVVLAASPTLTGAPLAPTPATTDSSTKLATTAYVQAQKYAATFGSTTNLVIAGATHGLGTADLVVAVYDSATGTRTLVIPNSVTIDSTLFTVTVTFASAQAGRIVILAI